ncbi:MAG TPA: hypothetical protein VEG64_02145 [Candidatus Sulfotelmatobacter sp.]|nr:hypothetical protein [Candidatus Sulfotelmatobacter sp.]
MSPEIESLAVTIERELSLLRELAGDLIDCRKAFTGMDLDGIYTHVAKQALLCDKLQKAEEERVRIWQQEVAKTSAPAAGADLRAWIERQDPAVALRLRALLTELVVAEGEVRNLNRVHRLLIDGSRKTLKVLTNALAAFHPTYPAPPTAKPFSTAGARP